MVAIFSLGVAAGVGKSTSLGTTTLRESAFLPSAAGNDPAPRDSYIYKVTFPFIRPNDLEPILPPVEDAGFDDAEEPIRRAFKQDFAQKNRLLFDVLLPQLLDMSEAAAVPELKKLGVRWFKWNSLRRGELTPEVHLVPASNPRDIETLNYLANAGKVVWTSFLQTKTWSIYADNHTSMFVDPAYFNQVLDSLLSWNGGRWHPKAGTNDLLPTPLEDRNRVAFFGPVAREDTGAQSGPFQLYIQMPGYPYVLELDSRTYDFQKKHPLCRVPNVATGQFGFKECGETDSKSATSKSGDGNKKGSVLG